MVENLLLSGLMLLPFYEFVIYLLMPTGKIPDWIDLRVTKEYIAIGLALTLTAVVWREVKKIECPNKWALFFLIFMFLNLSKTPIGVVNPIVDVSLLGSYSAEFKVFSFFLMFCSLASCRFSKEFIEKIFRVILIGAVVMSGYMILQALNLDQIYKPKPEYLLTKVKCASVGGFFGQPTLAIPFLVMAIPFAVYFKKPLAVISLSAAALMTGSDFAYISLVLLAILYVRGIKAKAIIGICVVVALGAGYYFKPHGFFNDNGRFFLWTQILKDVFSGEINGVPVRIGLFGAGLNNFGEIYTALHNSAYTRAHNEFFEILWCCGVVGEAIFVMIHFDAIKTAVISINDSQVKTLFFALCVLVLCATGTFLYQLGVYQFYIIAIVALIYQLNAKSVEMKNVRKT